MRILLLLFISVFLSAPAQAADKATIGGAFTLTDQNGKSFSSDSLRGKYTLIFFGFTQCPDTCPATLMNLTQAMQKLGNTAAVVPLFISVDPQHDTPAALKTYLSHFSPAIIGLTGSKEQLRKIESDYKIYASQVTDKASPSGYTVEHSAYIYLMDRQGNYLDHFANDASADQIVARIKALHQ